MSEETSQSDMLRSAVSVVAGFILANILIVTSTLAIDRFFGSGTNEAAVQPGAARVLLTFAAQFVFFVVGGCLTAVIARHEIMRHIAYLVAVALVYGAAGTIAAWSSQPFWYSAVITLLPIPGAILGGRLVLALSRPSPTA